MPERTLIVFTASTRSHEITWESVMERMIRPLRADVAVCGAFPDGAPGDNPITRAAKWVWPYAEVEDYGVHYDQMAARGGKGPMQRKKLLAVRSQWLGGIHGPGAHSGSAAIVLLFKQLAYEHIVLAGLDQAYDRFIITRSDHFHGADHPAMESLDPSFVWVPNGSDSGGDGICDRHWIMGPQHLRNALSLVDPMLDDPDRLVADMSRMSCWNPEAYIAMIWRRNGIMKRVRRCPRTMYLVRGPKDKTRWQAGRYNPEAGMIVKYHDEYEQFKKDNPVHDNVMRIARELLEKHVWPLFPGGGSVLDVGSYDVNGTYRPLFPAGWDYLGVDIEKGPNVDLVVAGEHPLWGQQAHAGSASS